MRDWCCCHSISPLMAPRFHVFVGAATVRQQIEQHVGRQREQARPYLTTVCWPGEATVHSTTDLRSWPKSVQACRHLPWFRKRAAWHPGVDIYWQGCAWADSAFCNSWAGNTFRKGVCGASIEVPEKESILFADNLYGQTTDEFKRALSEKCNTLLWLLPPEMHRRGATCGCRLREALQGLRGSGSGQVAS